MAQPNLLPLVPDRACGGCVACCQFLPISVPELEKPANLLCRHCVEGGCGIYERRPEKPCRVWHCGWRHMAKLGEEWRPDISGVIIRIDVPGVVLLVIGDPDEVLRREAFATLVAASIAAGNEVFLEFPGPPGFFPSKSSLNAPLAEGITRRDLALVQRAMIAIKDEVFATHVWERDGLTMRSVFGP
jgi:hypothetical protein